MILDNLKALIWPFLIAWGLFGLSWAIKPYRFRNCCLLMLALLFTAMLIAGLFGEYMEYALGIIALLIMLAIFLVPLMLIVNGITMLRREGRSPAHLLSLLVGVLIGLGECAAVFTLLKSCGYFPEVPYHATRAVFFFMQSAIYFCLLMLAFVLYMLILQVMPHRRSFDFIIIHGSGLIDGSRVPKLLANRLDRAVKLYHKNKKKPLLIPSGGQGADESLPEAEAMAAYLIEKGIPAEHILCESKSATTMENLQFSKALIDERGGGKVALVSSNYHVFRCLTYAGKLKLRCSGIGAPVAWYYWPSAVIREFVAVFRQPHYILWTLAGYLIFVVPVLVYATV